MPFANVRSYQDDDGFAPPTLRGAKASKIKKITYSASGAKELFTIPAGAIITNWRVTVQTAFNAAGNDLLDLGKSGSAAFFANDLDVSAKTQLTPASTGADPAAVGNVLTADTVITATYAYTSTAPTAGVAIIEFEYIWMGPGDTIEDVS